MDLSGYIVISSPINSPVLSGDLNIYGGLQWGYYCYIFACSVRILLIIYICAIGCYLSLIF